jgi:hypothetical protein
MSSPRRGAKGVAKSAAKGAARPPTAAAAVASADAAELAVAIERGIADGRLDVLSADALQALLAAVCRVYAARSESGEQFAPVKPHAISATDAMVTASGLLRAADLSTFELGMWQNWTGR